MRDGQGSYFKDVMSLKSDSRYIPFKLKGESDAAPEWSCAL